MDLVIRHGELDDYEALHRIFSGSRAIEGTLQLPLPSAEMWRKRLSEKPEGVYALVACADGEVVGDLTLETHPTRWRRRHVAQIGMAMRDDWQGKGIGTALMEAALDLADNWLNLTRIELTVYTDDKTGIALYEKFGFEPAPMGLARNTPRKAYSLQERTRVILRSKRRISKEEQHGGYPQQVDQADGEAD